MKKTLTLLIIAVLAASLFASLASAQIVGSGSIDSGLVGYWRLDENINTVVYDSSPNLINGSTVNYPYWVNGIYGNSLNLSLPQRVEFASDSRLMLYDNFSVSFWMFPNGTINGYSSLIGYAGTGAYTICLMSDYKLRINCYGSFTYDFDYVFTNNQWSDVVITVNNGNCSLFVNGEFKQSQAVIFVQGTNLYFGDFSTYSNFNGLIDEVRLSNRVLTNTEISELYNGYNITFSSDANSSISPLNYNGLIFSLDFNSFDIQIGVDQIIQFNITANSGYFISSIVVNNVTYSYSNIINVYGDMAKNIFVNSELIESEPTNTPNPTLTNQGLDILIYVFMVVIELITMLLALKLKGLGLLGLFGGLLGALFSYIAFTNEYLLINTTFNPVTQSFVNQTYAMGFFAWIPLILAISNFIATVYAK